MPLFSGQPADQATLAALVADEGVSPRVVDAFRAIDRAMFVPADARARAYVDRPIEILEGQTTSQPSLIARMIDAADLLPGDTVLEVGTGFGYQTALLAHLAGSCVSIERHAALAEAARTNLEAADVEGVEIIVGDGWQGWEAGGPYDAIIVSAAADQVPEMFVEQLKEGGRLVIPVRGPRGDDVLLYLKRTDHLVMVKLLTPARFVPLVPGEVADQSNE
jgi:protein-L-isoaspartate(D-aspartate) O-methyltransferase